jgi:hypothetical protein
MKKIFFSGIILFIVILFFYIFKYNNTALNLRKQEKPVTDCYENITPFINIITDTSITRAAKILNALDNVEYKHDELFVKCSDLILFNGLLLSTSVFTIDTTVIELLQRVDIDAANNSVVDVNYLHFNATSDSFNLNSNANQLLFRLPNSRYSSLGSDQSLDYDVVKVIKKGNCFVISTLGRGSSGISANYINIFTIRVTKDSIIAYNAIEKKVKNIE